jgi:hypothetical protein
LPALQALLWDGGCRRFCFSRSHGVEAVVSRELVRNVYLHSPLATEFGFGAHACLEGWPLSWQVDPARGKPIGPYDVGPGWVTFPSTALLEDFPPSTCAGGHLHAHNDSTPEPEWDDSATNFDSQRDHILHADCARNRSNIFSRRTRHFFMRHEIVWRSNPFRATSHQICKGSMPRWRTPRHRRAWGCIKAIPQQERTN